MNVSTISIITPTYNSENFIEKTIQSVSSQTYKNYEHLIIDDCSSDQTIDIVQKYKKSDSRIKLIKMANNGGAAKARNVGIKSAKSKYIAFIDSDDIWEPDKLKKQLEFMEKTQATFSYTAYQIIKEDGKPIEKYIDTEAKHIVNYKDMLLKKSTLGCSTVMLDKERIGDEIEMPLIRTGQDYALWLKLLKNGHNAYCLNEALTRYRIVSNSISRNKIKKARRQWQIYREIEKISLIPAFWYFINYAYRAVSR